AAAPRKGQGTVAQTDGEAHAKEEAGDGGASPAAAAVPPVVVKCEHSAVSQQQRGGEVLPPEDAVDPSSTPSREEQVKAAAAAVAPVADAPARYIRLHFGDTVLLRVSVKLLDHAIAACLTVCCTLLLKKCIWV
ncbi:hypothetical protein DQ04_20361010, partial [Trypanosoma grayi]|uniref:hypothetical protein n=1 Tax=Trypanosoma grayi TaxID=71804 RepID=UPI0004F49687